MYADIERTRRSKGPSSVARTEVYEVLGLHLDVLNSSLTRQPPALFLEGLRFFLPDSRIKMDIVPGSEETEHLMSKRYSMVKNIEQNYCKTKPDVLHA